MCSMRRFAGAWKDEGFTSLLPSSSAPSDLHNRLEGMGTAELPRGFRHYIQSLLLDYIPRHQKYRAWPERSDP